MRTFGLLAIVFGVLAFIYSGDQLKGTQPVPEGLTARESLEYPRARWETARYGAAALVGFGVLMAMFPKGR
ncbi:MAG TPA: hypothetical protein VI589_07675 [Vicinamibacteria bacterium]